MRREPFRLHLHDEWLVYRYSHTAHRHNKDVLPPLDEGRMRKEMILLFSHRLRRCICVHKGKFGKLRHLMRSDPHGQCTFHYYVPAGRVEVSLCNFSYLGSKRPPGHLHSLEFESIGVGFLAAFLPNDKPWAIMIRQTQLEGNQAYLDWIVGLPEYPMPARSPQERSDQEREIVELSRL